MDTYTYTADDLQNYRITSLPPEFYYIPNFITPEEEQSILNKIPPNRWHQLSHRRVQSHPSTLTATNTLLASALPTYLSQPIIPRLEKLAIFHSTKHRSPNHVLVNEYLPGQGIFPHQDGSAYECVVATVSLGAGLCLDIHVPADARTGYVRPKRIFQERRSLLVTRGEAYGLLHGIEGVEVDEGLGEGAVENWGLLGEEMEEGARNVRGRRVSLTYRDVGRVSGVLGRVFGRERGRG